MGTGSMRFWVERGDGVEVGGCEVQLGICLEYSVASM